MAGVTYPYHLQSVETFILQVNGGQPRQLTLEETDVISAYVLGAVQEITAMWPVDTGNSHDNWEWFVDGHVGSVGFTVENLVDYADFVHRSGEETPLAEGEVPDILDRWIDRMLPALRAAIQSTQAELARTGASVNTILQRKGKRSYLDRLRAVLGG